MLCVVCEERKAFAKAEPLYLDAIAEAGMTYRNGKIIGGKEDEEEEAVDNGEDGEYNGKEEIRESRKQVRYISDRVIGNKTLGDIRRELIKLYDGIESGVADEIAVVVENNVYILDSGKEHGKIDFKVRKIIKNTNVEFRNLILEEINEKSISDERISDELFERIRDSYNNDSGSTIGRELGKEYRSDTKESENNKETVSDGNGIGGIRELKESAEVSKERIISDKSDIRQSRKVETEDYTYDALTSKPDMEITVIKDGIQYTPSAQTRKNIVDRAIKNAASIGYTNENGNVVVYVEDIGADVIIAKHGLEHGLDRRLNVLAPITLNAGEILKNSIRINELNPKSENISASYILIGIAKNQNDVPYIVEFVVNGYTNELKEVDVLYSINTKKESGVLNEPAITEKPLRITDSKISISQLLDFVNRYFPDVLPEDVLRHYRRDVRPNGAFSQSVRFSKKVETEEKAVTDKEKIKELEKKVFFLGKQAKYSKEMAPTLRKLFDMAQSQVRDKVYYKQDAINAINNRPVFYF